LSGSEFGSNFPFHAMTKLLLSLFRTAQPPPFNSFTRNFFSSTPSFLSQLFIVHLFNYSHLRTTNIQYMYVSQATPRFPLLPTYILKSLVLGDSIHPDTNFVLLSSLPLNNSVPFSSCLSYLTKYHFLKIFFFSLLLVKSILRT